MQQNLSSMIIPPSPYAQELVDALKPYADIKTIQPLRRLIMVVGGIKYCYLIIEGSVSVHQSIDDRLLVNAKAPSIFGMTSMVHSINGIYLKPVQATLVGKLPVDDVEAVLSKLNLWELLTRHMMVVTGKLYLHNRQLMAPSAFDLVCTQLMELMSEAHALRSSLTAERYIRDKTHLSRSRVMKILSDLRQGGYIELDRGRLVRIVHLPEKY